MHNPENSLIIASTRALPVFEFNTNAKMAKTKALENAALIGRVTDRDTKIIAVRAQQELKGLINAFEKSRQELKEPILQAGRSLDNLVSAEKLALEQEFGRVSNLVKEFDDAERRRVLEEERLQRLELERIEREKQAELKRIADEQAAKEAEARRIQEEANRKASEAQREAERLIAEAKNKKQREAAQAAAVEAKKQQEAADAQRLKQEAESKRLAEESAAKAAVIEEKSGDAAYAAARPIEITKVAGQRTSYDWEITRIDKWILAKGRPDLVSKIEFDMRALKDELRRGIKLPGVEAREVYNPGVKVPKQKAVIDV